MRSIGISRKLFLTLATAFVAGTGILSRPAAATTYTWVTSGGTTTWATASNWSPSGPPSSTGIAQFNGSSYSAQPNVASTTTCDSILDSGSAALTLSATSGKSLTLTPASSSNGITVSSGAGAMSMPTAASAFEIGASQTWTNNSSNVLTVPNVALGGALTLTVDAASDDIAIGSMTAGSASTITLSGSHHDSLTSVDKTATSLLTFNGSNSLMIGSGQTLTFDLDGTGSKTPTMTVGNAIVNNTAGASGITVAAINGATNASTLTLTGTNTYTGTTTLQGGTLVLASTNNIADSGTIIVGDSSADSSAQLSVGSSFTLGGSQTLAGFGTIIGGNVTTSGGSILAPGNASVGTTTYGTSGTTRNLTLASGTVLDYQFGAPGTSSRSAVTGLLTLPTGAGSITLNLTNAGGLTTGTYTLFTYGTFSGGNGTFTNTFTIGSSPLSGDTYTFTNSSGTIQLTISSGGGGGGPTAVTGPDEAVLDTSGSGQGTGTTSVALNGSNSTAGTGTITSYSWTWTDTVAGVTTQHTATGATPTVNLYSGLYDGYQNLNNGINDITLTVTNSSGQHASATQRVWVYPSPNYWVATTGSDSNNGTSQSTPFKTIEHAINSVSQSAGHVIMVMGGTYYESPKTSGSGNSTTAGASTSGQITVMGYPLQSTIVDESDPLTTWTQCPSTVNGFSVPNYTHIWYTNVAVVAGVNTNLNWASTHVTQYIPSSGTTTELVCASVPLASGNASTTGGTPYEFTGGKYVLTGGTASADIIDTTHLQNNSNYPNGFFNGANVVLEQTSNQMQITGLTVSSFVSSTGTLNLTGASFNTPTANKDGYTICNLPEIMNVAGTYADVKQSNGTYNLYVWATDGSNPGTDGYVFTAGHRTTGVATNSGSSYWTFDNMEVRHVELTTGTPQAFGDGSQSSAGSGIIYQNCLADHNNGPGFYISESANLIITHCTSVYNHWGMMMEDCSNGLVQYCELGWNWEDGIDMTGNQGTTYDGDTETVDSTYIHDTTSYNHADGVQTWGYLTGATVTNTVQVNLGDELQTQNTKYLTYNNGISVGSSVNGVFAQGDNNTLEANTLLDVPILMSNSEATSQSQNWTLMNNVVQSTGNAAAGNVPANSNSFISNYNDWYVQYGITYTPVIDYLISNPWSDTWAQYQSASGQDSHSYGNCASGGTPAPNPLFTNVPTGYTQVNEADYYLNTPTTIYLTAVANIAVNDYVELNWDGVLRQVTAINSTNDYITFTPADNAVSEGYLPSGMADWGQTKPASAVLNLAFQAGSPAIGHSSTGGNMGSSVNLANWLICDFHATGRREIPADPSP